MGQFGKPANVIVLAKVLLFGNLKTSVYKRRRTSANSVGSKIEFFHRNVSFRDLKLTTVLLGLHCFFFYYYYFFFVLKFRKWDFSNSTLILRERKITQ